MFSSRGPISTLPCLLSQHNNDNNQFPSYFYLERESLRERKTGQAILSKRKKLSTKKHSSPVSPKFRYRSIYVGWPAMSFSGERRSVVSSSLMVMLIISLLHIWAFSVCRVSATRILQANTEQSQTMKANKNQADQFHNFFNGRVSDLNKTDKGFQENKRRVPSCPDPLHNK